jgi:imidazolonepropionase-like amidohydrolase
VGNIALNAWRYRSNPARGAPCPLASASGCWRTQPRRAWLAAAVLLPGLSTGAPAVPVVDGAHVADSGTLAVHCARLLDGVSAQALEDAVVVIEHGRVSYAGSAAQAPAVQPRLELPEHTCLPGLIDLHDHIADRPTSSYDLRAQLDRTDEELAQIGRENAAVTLGAGFTAVRSPGAYRAWAENALRERVNRGEFPGPRIQAAGIYLTVPGGGGDLLIPGVPEVSIPPHLRTGVARGTQAFAERATLAVDHGADFIKVIASGAVLAHGGVPGAPEMTPAELRAVVEVAHAAGIKVAAHAHGAQSIVEAIEAGADTIEHASLADDRAIALAAQRGVAFAMDVYNGDYIATEGRRNGWPEEFLRKNDETTAAQRSVFRKALAAGVPIVFATDAPVCPHGTNARQFAVMVGLGMSPMQAIRSATVEAARVMGWEDRVGTLAPGRFGDLIAVRGDPLADIAQLEHVDVVVKGGALYKNDATTPAHR